MGPRIDAHLELVNSGRTVKVVGPIGPWDGWVVSGTFWVVVAQVQGDKIVFATGRSDETYEPPAADWDADAKVGSGSPKLVLGQAYAWGVASFKTSNGQSAPFEWAVNTHLV